MALVFGLVGLFYNPFLVFIALFVWMGAAAESSMVQMKSALAGIPVSKVMITHFRSLAPGNSLQEVIDTFSPVFSTTFRSWSRDDLEPWLFATRLRHGQTLAAGSGLLTGVSAHFGDT